MNVAGIEPASAFKRRLPPRVGKRSRIGFFGIFGIQNLGNECTLQAILKNAQRRLPDDEIYAISFNPADTVARHKIPAYAVTYQDFSGVNPRTGFIGGLEKLLRLIRRVPGELNDWLKAIKTLRGTSVVFMTGTGMLTDYMTSASGFPYHVFRWAAASRLAGCKVRFVGVGVSPIYGRMSRWLIRAALSLADYRSFRDQNSKDKIRKYGFNSDNDYVFPDLVFSLPPETCPPRNDCDVHIRTVGLGVMDHWDIHLWSPEKHQAIYSAYLETMCDFVKWLIKHSYGIRILQGDSKHDARARADLKARLERRGIHYETAGIIDEGSTTVEQLIGQIAKTDIVISPRFHSLLLGLMMNIPGISISYDPKNDALLDSVGLGEYRQAIDNIGFQKLVDQFKNLELRINDVKPLIEQKSKEHRALLENQYDKIFSDFFGSTRQ